MARQQRHAKRRRQIARKATKEARRVRPGIAIAGRAAKAAQEPRKED